MFPTLPCFPRQKVTPPSPPPFPPPPIQNQHSSSAQTPSGRRRARAASPLCLRSTSPTLRSSSSASTGQYLVNTRPRPQPSSLAPPAFFQPLTARGPRQLPPGRVAGDQMGLDPVPRHLHPPLGALQRHPQHHLRQSGQLPPAGSPLPPCSRHTRSTHAALCHLLTILHHPRTSSCTPSCKTRPSSRPTRPERAAFVYSAPRTMLAAATRRPCALMLRRIRDPLLNCSHV